MDIFCAETTPKAAKPRIIKAATMLITKRTVPLLAFTDMRVIFGLNTIASASGAYVTLHRRMGPLVLSR